MSVKPPAEEKQEKQHRMILKDDSVDLLSAKRILAPLAKRFTMEKSFLNILKSFCFLLCSVLFIYLMIDVWGKFEEGTTR